MKVVDGKIVGEEEYELMEETVYDIYCERVRQFEAKNCTWQEVKELMFSVVVNRAYLSERDDSWGLSCIRAKVLGIDKFTDGAMLQIVEWCNYSLFPRTKLVVKLKK